MNLLKAAKILNGTQEQFKLISLERHYPGITGGVKWAVATELAPEELEKVGGGELNLFKPYIVITPEQGEAFAQFERIEKRLEMEELRHHVITGYDEGLEFIHVAGGNPEEKTVNGYLLRMALGTLSEKQQRRFRLFFYYGYSETEIAMIEGVSQPAIHDSIELGLMKLKDILKL